MCINRFIDQYDDSDLKAETEYESGVVCKNDENEYIIGYEMKGARETFSVGQPVYDDKGNIMGYLGIGLYNHLDYDTTGIRIPVMFWKICLPTLHCQIGKKVYTYWQNEVRIVEQK